MLCRFKRKRPGLGRLFIILCAVFLALMAVLLVIWWPKEYSGAWKGAEYSYQRNFGSWQSIKINYPDGLTVIIHDINGGNVIGDVVFDSYKISKGDSYIQYGNCSDGVYLNGWDGEVLSKEAAFNKATEIFREWRTMALDRNN